MEIKNKRVKKQVNTFKHCEFAIFYEENRANKLIILGYGEEQKEVKIIINKDEIKKLKKLINEK